MNLTTRFTSPPALGEEIPKGLTLDHLHEPRLSPEGPITIGIVVVHHTKEEDFLDGKTILERVRGANGLPVDSIGDLRNILSRGLVCPHDHLITGVEVCRGTVRWPLILRKDEKGHWRPVYLPVGTIFACDCFPVLCYDPDASQ